MASPAVVGADRSEHSPPRDPADGRRFALIGISIVVAAAFASASLVVTSLAIRILLDDRSGVIATTMLAVGTTVGACTGALSTRQALLRLVTGSRHARGLPARGNHA